MLRTLVDNEIMLQRAEKLGLMATDADVEAKFNELKAPYTQEEFQKQLDARKMTCRGSQSPAAARSERGKAVQQGNHLADQHHRQRHHDFYNANKASFNLAEPQIHMAQILVTPTPDPNVRNLKNDKAQDEDAGAARKSTICTRGCARARISPCWRRTIRRIPTRRRTAAIWDSFRSRPWKKPMRNCARPSWRCVRARSPACCTRAEGYRILKVITREPAGQRELTDPKVQQTIRETLINRKDQLLKAAYYEVARNEAKVVNYFANRIVGSQEKNK